MICGVVSASSGDSGSNPYPDSLAVMDFITGDYWIGDASSNAAAMINRPDLITASGLLIDWDDPNGAANPIGAFLTLLLTSNWTLVIEVTENDTGSMYPFYMRDLASVDATYINTGDTNVAAHDQPDPGADRSVNITSVVARPAIRRIAMTRTNAKQVISVNGSAVNTDTTSTSTPSHGAVTLGGDPLDSGGAFMLGHIRRIILYSPQTDAALPGLSTV